MNLTAELRQDHTCQTPVSPNIKVAVKDFAMSIAQNYPVALTLTLKQTQRIKNANGVFMKKLDEAECEKLAERFIKKLNREVFGKRGAEKRGNGLKYFVVIEGGGWTGKNLHLHMAIGALPAHVKFEDMDALVCKAKQYVEGVDERHTVKRAVDDGWMDYITKEVSKSNSNNVLWRLA